MLRGSAAMRSAEGKSCRQSKSRKRLSAPSPEGRCRAPMSGLQGPQDERDAQPKFQVPPCAAAATIARADGYVLASWAVVAADGKEFRSRKQPCG